MAEMNRNWQRIQRHYMQEYFWLGEFIQSDRWLESACPNFTPANCLYCKDGFGYGGRSFELASEIHATEMTYATSLNSMLSIINEGGFRPLENDYPGIGRMSLVWFGLKITDKEIYRVKENSISRVQDLMQNKPELKADSVLSQIARTPAFNPMPLYGNFKFTIAIKEVLQAYATQFCGSLHDTEIRKLGTFAYEKETVHVILVCPPVTTGTDNCPLLSDDPVIQPDAMFETWTWKPHFTGGQYITFLDSGNACFNNARWERVAFAFYVPKDCCLKINDLESRVSLCLERSRPGTIFGVNDVIKKMLDSIESTEATEKKSLADTLIKMIAGYLKEERLYEKTLESCSNEAYVHVNLDLVVQRLQALLPSLEFKELNWWPLTEWKNSLTKHTNVLHFIVVKDEQK